MKQLQLLGHNLSINIFIRPYEENSKEFNVNLILVIYINFNLKVISTFYFQVLGREVYTSNNQLGGVQIMHNNGVTHTTVTDDFEGVFTILQWLSYMPKVVLKEFFFLLYLLQVSY